MNEIRKALRMPAVLEATGWPKSTLYLKIEQGKCPAGTRLDPDGRAVVWWADEIAKVQAGTWRASKTEVACS